MITLPNKVLFALWPRDAFHRTNPDFLKMFNGPLKMCSILTTTKEEHNTVVVEHMSLEPLVVMLAVSALVLTSMATMSSLLPARC
jgi:hypothetical protein